MQEPHETQVRSLGQEDPLEEGMATHSSILAWRIPGTEDLAGYSPQGHKKLDRTEATQHAHTCDHWHFVHCFLAVLAIFSVTFFSFFLPLWFDDFRGMLRFLSLSLIYLLQVFAL